MIELYFLYCASTGNNPLRGSRQNSPAGSACIGISDKTGTGLVCVRRVSDIQWEAGRHAKYLMHYDNVQPRQTLETPFEMTTGRNRSIINIPGPATVFILPMMTTPNHCRAIGTYSIHRQWDIITKGAVISTTAPDSRHIRHLCRACAPSAAVVNRSLGSSCCVPLPSCACDYATSSVQTVNAFFASSPIRMRLL